MIPILAGWEVNDTITNESEPAKTWVVTVIENKQQGRWVEIKNTPDCVDVEGTGGMAAYESIFVRMQFHAFRQD